MWSSRLRVSKAVNLFKLMITCPSYIDILRNWSIYLMEFKKKETHIGKTWNNSIIPQYSEPETTYKCGAIREGYRSVFFLFYFVNGRSMLMTFRCSLSEYFIFYLCCVVACEVSTINYIWDQFNSNQNGVPLNITVVYFRFVSFHWNDLNYNYCMFRNELSGERGWFNIYIGVRC